MKYLGPKTDAANLAAQGDLPIAVSSTPPAGASEGDLWLDSDTGRLYCYYDAQWINPASVGRSVSTAAATTITGTNSEGTSNSLARADHNHAFGDKSIPPKALPARCGCIVKHSVSQSIANNTITQLAFDGENLDTDSFHSTSVNNSRITIPTGLAGVYSVFVHIRWEVTATTQPNLMIQVNGTAVTRTTAVTANYTSQSVSWVGYLAETDYITAGVYQQSGANRNVDAVGAGALDPLSPTMGVFRVGGLA